MSGAESAEHHPRRSFVPTILVIAYLLSHASNGMGVVMDVAGAEPAERHPRRPVEHGRPHEWGVRLGFGAEGLGLMALGFVVQGLAFMAYGLWFRGVRFKI